MAAKEESVVLKYLKKNPGAEALDISFGTDIDEAIVKETLQQLLSKQMVAAKMDDRGVPSWSIAEPPKAAPAPKPEKVKPVREESEIAAPKSSAPEVDDAPSSGGTGKGFVFAMALIFALVSVGVSYVLAGIQINAAKSAFDLQLKTAQDSLGMFRIQTNNEMDALKQDMKKLQAPPPAEEKAAPEKPAKKAKPAKKKKR
jgi:hypothetical protein